MDYDLYRTTLRAMTNCTVVKISRVMFEKWMYSDIRAMKYEAKQVGEYLLEEGRNSRLFLFMQGRTDWRCCLWNVTRNTRRTAACT